MGRQLGLWWITISDTSAKFKTLMWHSLLEKTLPISTIGISRLLQENYQRCFTVSLCLQQQSVQGSKIFIDWNVIEFCWIFISKHCFNRKTVLKTTPTNNFQFLLTPFLGTKSLSQAHQPLWLPEKLLFPSAVCCAFLPTVMFLAAGTAKRVYTVLQVRSLCRNIASIKPTTSID